MRGATTQIFAGQDKVPFHHLPEYVNRFLVAAAPVVIEYTVPCVPSDSLCRTEEADARRRIDKDSENAHAAFDIQISVLDPVQGEIDRASKLFGEPSDLKQEIATLDEKVRSLLPSSLTPLTPPE